MACHKDQYPGVRYQTYDESQGLDQSSEYLVTIPDVPLAFSRISSNANYLECSDGGCFPKAAYSGANSGGSKANTHFQGLVRHHDGRTLFLSGGESVRSAAQMFTIKLDRKLDLVNHDTSLLSTYEKGVINRNPLGYNATWKNKTSDIEKVVRIEKINDIVSDQHEKGFWHAGGFSRLRDLYAVPLESKNDSTVRFFTLDSNHRFCHLSSAEIKRTANKAGAVAICRFKNQRYFVAVWQDADRNGNQNIDFYLSKSTSILDGFFEPVRWHYRDCLSSDNINITYQNIQFLLQDDEQLFLVGMENTSNAAPKVKGSNVAELLSIKFNKDLNGQNPTPDFTPSIRLSNKKEWVFSSLFNFDAGSSLFIDKNKELSLYATFHYLRNKAVRIVEFPTMLEVTREPINSIHFARIELYEDENFGGKIFRIYGDVKSEIDNTENLYLLGKKYKKGFKSLKIQIPAGSSFTIYTQKSFKKGFEIFGNGRVGSIVRVGKINNFGNEIKSFRYTKIGNTHL